MALGVGAIIGTGIYTLTGVAAGLAGPAVILSFAVAGVVCACAALCYAEMASLSPQAGSAYAYSYMSLGELVAWIVGWSLILEYTLVCSAVAVGWAGYATGLIHGAHIPIPESLLASARRRGGIVNLPAVFIALVVTGVLLIGTRESATVNFVLVCVKLRWRWRASWRSPCQHFDATPLPSLRALRLSRRTRSATRNSG